MEYHAIMQYTNVQRKIILTALICTKIVKMTGDGSCEFLMLILILILIIDADANVDVDVDATFLYVQHLVQKGERKSFPFSYETVGWIWI